MFPKSRCFGYRPWDPVKKTWGDYKWDTFEQASERRANIGKGLVELHAEQGVSGTQYGIGLWCQNRPEWQLTGMLYSVLCLYIY